MGSTSTGVVVMLFNFFLIHPANLESPLNIRTQIIHTFFYKSKQSSTVDFNGFGIKGLLHYCFFPRFF